MIRLDGKRLLFVAPPFFGYHSDIISEIRSRGCVVDWLPDRLLDSPVARSITRFAPSLVLPVVDYLYEKMLYAYGAAQYDFVLVINGQTLSRALLKSLRCAYPGAMFVLYMWDSVANRRHIARNFMLYDRVLSFDPSDASLYGLSHRPLFYGPSFYQKETCSPFLYDLSFVGTAHSDRYEVIDRLRRALPNTVTPFLYLYLQAPWVYYLYRAYKPGMLSAKRQDFRFLPLGKESINQVFLESRAILDIAHPRQHGLTMRTFEVLGAGKKLVTTNTSVRDCDFFADGNICIIDRVAPLIPPEFFSTPYEPIDPLVMSRYTLAGWLNEVLDLSVSTR